MATSKLQLLQPTELRLEQLDKYVAAEAAHKDTLKPIQGWIASQKCDGYRAYVSPGKVLRSRKGAKYSPPPRVQSFLDTCPYLLDGELVAEASLGGSRSTLARALQSSSDAVWDSITLYVFDYIPMTDKELEIPYKDRVATLKQWFSDHASDAANARVVLLTMVPVRSWSHLRQLMLRIKEKGQEGLVVRSPTSPYEAGKTSKALKVKPTVDEDAVVVAHGDGIIVVETGPRSLVKARVKQGVAATSYPLGSRVTIESNPARGKEIPRVLHAVHPDEK